MQLQVNLPDQRTVAAGLLAAGILVGVAVPSLAKLMQPLALSGLFLVVVFSLVPFARLRVGEIVGLDFATCRVLCWQLIVLPSIVLAVGYLSKFPDNIVTLMVVTACAGSLFASPTFAELLDLHRRRTLQGMVLSTLFMPVSLFLFLSIHHGPNVDLDVVLYVERTLIFLGVPFVMFAAYRRLSRNFSAAMVVNVEATSRWAMVVSLIVFGIGIMPPVAERLATNPMQVMFYLFVAAMISIGMLLLTIIVMYKFSLTEAMTAATLCGFRNVGLTFALIGGMVGPEFVVYVGVSLIPIFMGPLFIRLVTHGRTLVQELPAA